MPVVGRFFDELLVAWSRVVVDPPVALVNVVKLEWCGVIDADDAVELIDFVDAEDEGSLTRERKWRNVDNGEDVLVKTDEEEEVDEHNDWDECVGKPSWWGR